LMGTLGFGAAVVRQSVKPALVAAAIIVLGCAYAAPRLVPTAYLLNRREFQDQRRPKGPDYMSIEMLRRSLWDEFQPSSLKVTPGVQLFAWHEYGNYMGWFGATLSAVAAIWILFFRRPAHWAAAAS